MFVQRLTMAVLGALVVALLGLLGRRLAGRRAGLIIAGLAAVNPNFWMNDVLPMSETLATLGIVVILLGTYRFIDRPSVGRAAFLAVATGLAILARAELALFIPFTIVPVALMARSLSWPARIGRIAVVGVGAALMLVPWFAFNQTRFTEPVLLSTNDGITLLGANCDEVYGVKDDGGIGFWNLGCPWAYADQIPPGADQSVVSGIYRRAGLDYIRNHKRLLPRVETIRLARAWGVYAPDQMVWLNQGEGRDAWASWTGYAMWWLLLPGAVVGAVVLRRRRVAVWPLVSTALVVTFTVGVFYGIVRFRLPADVAAVVLAGVAVDALVRRLRREPSPTGAPVPAAAPDREPDRDADPASVVVTSTLTSPGARP
jgi:4-amino-4-deoxy-L-arabinose transferase-like glycosyltransferase